LDGTSAGNKKNSPLEVSSGKRLEHDDPHMDEGEDEETKR
jgi:hypothetical protein